MPDIKLADISKNNRGRDSVGVYMSYSRFDELVAEVKADEQARIIALLEAKTKCRDPEMCGDYCECGTWAFRHAIALIKEEQE